MCREGFRMGSQSEDLPFVKGCFPRGLGNGSKRILILNCMKIMEKLCTRCGVEFCCASKAIDYGMDS